MTLASLTAFSVNDQWQPAFIESTAGRVHKLSNLDSLAVYFDTDAKSIAGLPYQESIDTFNKMVNNKFRRRTAILELTSK